ncbi:MAG: tRNA (adenosine(37)-N6)-threonylcarbamoyltransferase complex ATPase subunit type 1 TsaE [Pseudomonadota bacterium]
MADEQATLRFGRGLGHELPDAATVYLEGDLGAGKTTLTRGVLHALGHAGAVRSPTYTLIESYALPDCTVHHLDLYRLGSTEELYDLGIDDLAAEPAVWLIEWPALAAGVLPVWTHRVALSVSGTGRDVDLARRPTAPLRS